MATAPQPPIADITALAYRVASIEQRVARVEDELRTYVPVRENELQLKAVRDTTQRIETEVQDIKMSLADLTTRLADQREAQDKLQIRALWGIVSTVITVLVGILIAYVTHLFH